jgi:hypothetical protein
MGYPPELPRLQRIPGRDSPDGIEVTTNDVETADWRRLASDAATQMRRDLESQPG